VSILPNISKIFERLLHDQIFKKFDEVFSKYQCGFVKNYSAQHPLMFLVESWKKALDNGDYFGALLTDLSKAFDCLSHELLIAKLKAYNWDNTAVKLISDYLTNRKQKVKINGNLSEWEDILTGVPQGSILGPLLFNIYMCDLFYIIENQEFASYADDNTPFVTGKTLEEVKTNLEIISKKFFTWLSNNQMKGNPDKCHLLPALPKGFYKFVDFYR